MIYFDHASTTPLRAAALVAMQAAPFGNPSSPHAEGRRARAALETARTQISQLVHAYPDEVFFTSGATESCAWAIRTMANVCRACDTTGMEHMAVLIPASTSWRGRLTQSTAYLRSYANAETGEITQFVADRHPHDRLLLDATAAVGHVPVSFHGTGADYMAFTAHKFGGPKGLGVLLVRRGNALIPIFSGHQESEKRGGTESVPLACGAAAALAAAYKEDDPALIASIRDYLIDGIASLFPDARLNGPWTMGSYYDRLPGNVNVSFPGLEGTSLAAALSDHGIMVSTGSACTSGDSEPSHVLTAMGVPRDLALGTIRITLAGSNTVNEAEVFLQALKSLVPVLRGE